MSSTTLEPRTERSGAAVRPPKKRRPPVLPWTLLLPSLVVLGVLVGYPIVRLVVMSFQKYERAQLMGQPAEWVGFDNYAQVLTDVDGFWTVLLRSFLFMVVCVALTMLIGTLVALLMMRLGKGFRLLVSIGLLLAWAMPALAGTVVWGWIFDSDYGVVNNLLTKITGENWLGHAWLINPLLFFTVATIIIVWGAVPFVAFTMYAGLTQIPGEVLEAAQLDGAGPVKRFRLIMVPYVRSIITVLVVLSIIWDLRVFTQIYALQDIGGIREQTNTIGVYIYQMGMAQGHYGLAGAISVIFVFIMLAISFYYVRQTVREEEL
ncbi:carbohydrate ABC transporter permease [Cellulosimicrobium composti]|uniref:ABC transporter permease subunit n=1 Tax=Cellulosimicrobium composti TaxID=2672572 RepID=A0A6N7ZKF2_9MICO|nr:sugar ABC transporter permease [Cellulosimicrobium composti]MTG89984.1 ABC transporter permease subunit [Cellulosimicrobium composti]NDO91494.1 sugar ABC transporter permease [Cellulosimicrobium composti]TWG81258.1 N,N'-diacetylchitobiose transport system permease protein [Cellulosimicrobium cellulans J34]SMF48126.1 carbohydrate ABC transporter membrane protein 1, CUT1 family (TC 3.A.1.1.-) [Cellulosimicrobium cellulans J1]